MAKGRWFHHQAGDALRLIKNRISKWYKLEPFKVVREKDLGNKRGLGQLSLAKRNQSLKIRTSSKRLLQARENNKAYHKKKILIYNLMTVNLRHSPIDQFKYLKESSKLSQPKSQTLVLLLMMFTVLKIRIWIRPQSPWMMPWLDLASIC